LFPGGTQNFPPIKAFLRLSRLWLESTSRFGAKFHALRAAILA
jgi:hypothetical protein